MKAPGALEPEADFAATGHSPSVMQSSHGPEAARGHRPPRRPPVSRARFMAVYRQHVRFVWRCVRRLGVEGAQVEDVVQDAFVVVHRRLAEFEERSSLKTWLYGIVRRVVADHRRTQRRKPGHAIARVDVIDENMELDGPGDAARDCPQASAERAEQVALLHRVLGCLDDDKREVFVLAELEGMTMTEIGEAIDLNVNTVSSRLRAARREFEEALERLTLAAERATRSAQPRRSP